MEQDSLIAQQNEGIENLSQKLKQRELELHRHQEDAQQTGPRAQ